MPFRMYQDLGQGITRIDTTMVREELAACYLLQAGDVFAIIETGTNHTVPVVLDLLEQRGIRRDQVKFVIPTHVHLDHAGGVGGLMQALPEATLLIHPRGARHMIDPGKLRAGAVAVYGETTFAAIYGDLIPVDEQRVRSMEDGARVRVGDRELVFHDTPGHAKHHFCVEDRASGGIFTGDTFGLAYPALVTGNGPFILPTTTPVQFDPEALKASIDKLLSLSPQRLYLTHYGMLEGDLVALGKRLQGMVDDYVALAERVDAESQADSSLETRLKSALREYLFDRARAHGVEGDDNRLDQLLGLDITLNSQGLAVWLNHNR